MISKQNLYIVIYFNGLCDQYFRLWISWDQIGLLSVRYTNKITLNSNLSHQDKPVFQQSVSKMPPP